MPLIDPRQVAGWLVEREGLWQMKLLDPAELATYARDRGLNFSADDITLLWRLRLIKADLVLSPTRIRRRGLPSVGRDASGHYAYADVRIARPRNRGWADSARSLTVKIDPLRLRFHPFRYRVLFTIKWAASFDIMPIQPLVSIRGYTRLATIFRRMLKRRELAGTFERVNEAVSLAVASEPCVYPIIFKHVTYPAFTSIEEQRRRMADHKAEMLTLFKRITVRRLEDLHAQLCVDAYRLDSNRNVHALVRLAKGSSRLDARDNFGGALFLRTMAEVIRRMTEEAWDIKLAKEDHAGVGHTNVQVRERIYGSRRLFDADRSVWREFLRQFQLDFG